MAAHPAAIAAEATARLRAFTSQADASGNRSPSPSRDAALFDLECAMQEETLWADADLRDALHNVNDAGRAVIEDELTRRAYAEGAR